MSAEPTRWERVVFLAPFLPHLKELALAREEATRGWANTNAFNPLRETIGVMGEKAYSIVTGLPMNESAPGADGGIDFSDGADVKGCSHWSYPKLMRLTRVELVAPFYVLVAVDVAGARARLIGYATRREVFDAPPEDYGFGPTRVLRPEQLHPLPVPERRARPR